MNTPTTKRILIVEDDPSILLGLRMTLQSHGFEITEAQDGETGLRLAQAESWDLILLDVMLPKLNGYDVVSRMRASQDHTPVLMLSARGAEVDKIMGLDVGADDYITKPFAVGELLARIRVALRRRARESAAKPAPNQYRFGAIALDPATREVRRGPTLVELTATEFDVLVALYQANERVLTRRQIMDIVWGSNHHGSSRTVDNFIAQLRAKLEVGDTGKANKHLLTVRGVGYRLVR